MDNPVLVEVLRGGVVESRHRGAVAVVDADGGAVLALGDVERPVFPRSAVKALQALPLVESGAADRFGLTDEELALACASHSGEPGHVAAAQAMLARAGLDAAALRCGAHAPIHQPSAAALVRAGAEPSALHNNCSGKHAGFLCLACAARCRSARLCDPGHPVQREVRAAIESVSGAQLSDDRRGVDGCSVPTWAMPLRASRAAPSRASAPATGLRRSAPRRRRGCARPARRIPGTSPAPAASAPR